MKIAIRTSKGYYLTAVNGGGIGDPQGVGIPILTSKKSPPGPTEIFTLQQGYSEAGSVTGSVAIQCPNNHDFLTAVQGGGIPALPRIPSPITTTATTIGPDETFVLVPAGQPGQFAIRTAGGYYLTAVNSGGIGDPAGTSFNSYPIHTNAPAPNQWETMDLINVGSYSDTFEYKVAPSGPDADNFNNWYWEMYPQQPPVDDWSGFQFNVPVDDDPTPNATCSQVIVKANPATPVLYQDSEIFNNACNAEWTTNVACTGGTGGMQPPCNTPFPNHRLTTVKAPYIVTNSYLDQGGMFLQNPYATGGQVKNTPYYPSKGFPYCVEMRVKAEGQTYGTRGWGFWNTMMPPSPNVYFAWFWEFGVHFDLSDNSDNSRLPLVFPVALTTNGIAVRATILWVDYYKWHDYKIIWAEDSVQYFIDGQPVATHSASYAPPIGFWNGGMAYHCWVDNRLFYTANHGGYCPIALPTSKSNSMRSFKASWKPGATSNAAPPVEAITVSEDSTDLSKVLAKLTAAYLKQQAGKKNTKQ